MHAGGIFFDDLMDRPADQLLEFSSDCIGSVVQSYLPIVERRKDTPFTDDHKGWQQLRRGRYVEFNLVSISHQHRPMRLALVHALGLLPVVMAPALHAWCI